MKLTIKYQDEGKIQVLTGMKPNLVFYKRTGEIWIRITNGYTPTAINALNLISIRDEESNPQKDPSYIYLNYINTGSEWFFQIALPICLTESSSGVVGIEGVSLWKIISISENKTI